MEMFVWKLGGTCLRYDAGERYVVAVPSDGLRRAEHVQLRGQPVHDQVHAADVATQAGH